MALRNGYEKNVPYLLEYKGRFVGTQNFPEYLKKRKKAVILLVTTKTNKQLFWEKIVLNEKQTFAKSEFF